jgi:ribonuclease D
VVLRELARWREETARERNKPRSSVARDETLVEIARKAPTTVAALRGLRAGRSREVDRQAEAVVGRVVRALAIPKEEWPKPAPLNGKAPFPGVVELLQAVLHLRAEEASIAPSLLATQAELQRLVKFRGSKEMAELSIAQGWRYEIAGRDLVAVLEGRATVALDPDHGRVRIRIEESRG